MPHPPKLVFPAETVTRTPPGNLLPGDDALFAHEYTRSILPTHIYEYNGLAVNPDGAGFRGLRVQPPTLRNASQLSRYNWKTPLRLYLKHKAIPVSRLLHFTEEWSLGYFHWICDALPRLWCLRAYWESHQIWLPERYRVGYVQDSLALLGLSANFYPEGAYLKAQEAVVCDMVAPTGNYRPALVQSLFTHLSRLNHEEPPIHPAPRALFISRRKAPRRYIADEARISEQLNTLGVHTVQMEDYTFGQQIALLRHARLLIGLHGAGLTNQVFMPPGGTVLELRFESDARNNAYFSLANAMEHRYYYLTGQGSHTDTHSADLQIDPGQVAATIREALARQQ
ncbi:MAG: glycosyltransferase family 61 protein [Bacteroidetes bacterium]|nr:glycosyltransferase family 61 protein [Bacteroidota bacterium]